MNSISENPHAVQADFGVCQRWRNGRASYRPAGEPFDHRWATVEAIDEATAKAFVVKEHYSHSYPAARFRAGLFIKQPFKKEALLGVGVFSVPMNQRVIGAYFDGLEPNSGVELGRFCLLDQAAANAESWSLVRMKRLLKQTLPVVQGVIAYCDPIERRNSDGTVVKRGHVGTIYKATNSRYRGRSSARTLWLAPTGECLVDRMLSKIRSGDVGEAYAMDHLRKLGAPARAMGEPGDDYLQRLRAIGWMRPVRHPGNLAFTWVLP
ncbi:MAG: hypothetical protein Q7T63_02660 [Burkholderiaceae bacterium]|nr:hypothetical protein [Burkholderiaceae bacterium]MDP3135902.1 hypothetical protein [Burkholderiaceae bacterium]